MHNKKVEKVHLVFKNHLDLGFTDTAERVKQKYFTEFIPQAITESRKLRNTGTPYLWITGAWILSEFLENGPREWIDDCIDSIRNDELGWHALPFTFHSEAAGVEIFKTGMEFSRAMDARFGTETTSGKLTDVPGHTIGIIPLLRSSGVKFLHIGINDVSHPVDLPSLFRWRHHDGNEIVVNYEQGYGNITASPDEKEILIFSHKHDNLGPPSAEEVLKEYERVGRLYPHAAIQAAKLNSFGNAVWEQREELPLITDEMGDTWIHGIGSDPLKMAHYRQFIRQIQTWEDFYSDPVKRDEIEKAKRILCQIPEHTWGMDQKTYLPDYSNFEKSLFSLARKADFISLEEILKGIDLFVKPKLTRDLPGLKEELFSYSRFEKSWLEQRKYLSEAKRVINDRDLSQQLNDSLSEIEPDWPSTSGWEKFHPDSVLNIGHWEFELDIGTGSVCNLRYEDTMISNSDFLRYEYRIHSFREYQNYWNSYVQSSEENDWWGYQDFMKCGLEGVKGHESQCYVPVKPTFYRRQGMEKEEILVELTMPEQSRHRYGAPENVLFQYEFFIKTGILKIHFYWKDKDAVRIPESSWLRFFIHTKDQKSWKIEKLGTEISPFSVHKFGNRSLHCSNYIKYSPPERGNSNKTEEHQIVLSLLDSPLVSPGEPRILSFDQDQPDLDKGFSVNLHNNLWNTNFPMWYEDDLISRFVLEVT